MYVNTVSNWIVKEYDFQLLSHTNYFGLSNQVASLVLIIAQWIIPKYLVNKLSFQNKKGKIIQFTMLL